MAPEEPGNIVVLDLRFRNDALVGTVDKVEPNLDNPPAGWLRVAWNIVPKSADHFPLGNGVAYVSQPSGFVRSSGDPASIDSLGQSRYAWRQAARGEGLMLVLVLPKAYSLDTAKPRDGSPGVTMPRSAKVFKGRIAVYFKPLERYGASARVTWKLKPFQGDLRSEVERINREIISSENVPDNMGALVDEGVGVPAQAEEQPGLSALAYALIALVGLAIGVGLLLFYVYHVPKLVESGAQNQVFYLLLIPWALACAAFLFGAMRSYARFTYRHLGNALELGGPVVLFCLVLAGGFKLVPTAPQTFDLTVRAHSADGAEAIITSGKVTVELDTDRRAESFGANGEANFKGIPAKFSGETLRVLPQVAGYEEKWQRHKLHGNVLDLPLERAPQPVTQLTGSIIPPPKEWEKLRLIVDGRPVEGKVDSLGRFDFQVNGKEGDTIRLKIYDGTKLVYDELQTLPGPLTLTLDNK